MESKEKILFNYSYLRGFIRDHKCLGSIVKYAKFLGISPQELNKKLSSEHQFTPKQIVKTKHVFNLNPEEIDLYFFNTQFR